MGNISLEKLYTTSCRETCPNPFLKNQPGSTAWNLIPLYLIPLHVIFF